MTRRYRSSKTVPVQRPLPMIQPPIAHSIPFSIEVDGVTLEGKMNPAGQLNESGMPSRVTVFPKSKQPMALLCEDGRWYIFDVDYPELVEKLVSILTGWYK